MSRKPIKTHPVSGSQGKGVKNSFCYLPHYNMPGLNTSLMCNITNNDEASQHYFASDHFNLPVPYVPFLEIESKINTVLDLVNLKTQWKYENDILLQTCKKKLNSSTLNNLKQTLQNKKKKTFITVPTILTSYTSSLMKNPDQYFDSEYNWYFKNTIDKIKINGKWYLACARGVNLDILDIISITNNDFEKIESKVDKYFNGPIYDVKSSNLNELIIRQKTKLFIFWNDSDTEILLNNNLIHDNCDIPFTDADIMANNICTTDVKHGIKLWKDRHCLQDKYFEVEYDQTDSFMHLSYLPNQTDLIAIINRQKLYFVDTRIDISKPCSIYDPSTIIEPCEELSTLKNSQLNNHTLYIASNHSVLTLDNRIGFLNKSHHMLSNPPSIISTHCYENDLEPNEILFLGNQTGESFVDLSYTSCQDDFLVCQNMVSSIPKPLDSLHNVRLQGHCLDPILLNRFSRCLIGITVVGEHFKDLKLFTINSAGDLFVQQMNENTPVDVTVFKELVKIKSQTIPNLKYTNVFDMSKLWKLEPSENHNINYKRNYVWSMSKEKISSYVDHLAPLILSPWDIDDLSEWENEDENIEDLEEDSDCDYATKVNFWFNKNDSLLGITEPIKEKTVSKVSINLKSQNIITKSINTSENDEDSSSGFTVSIKTDDS